MKKNNLPVCIPDDFDDDFFALDKSEFEGEFNFGPVRVKGHSKSSDDSGAIIGGVLVGGAVAIGAFAVAISLLGGSKSR